MPLRGVIDDLRDMIHDVLLSDTAASRGLFQPQRVQNLLRDHYEAKRSRPHEIWALLMLELWFNTWIDGAGRLHDEYTAPVQGRISA